MQCLTLVYEILMQIWLTLCVKWLMREDLFKTIPSIVCTQLQEEHRSFLQKEGGTPQLAIIELESLIEEHIMSLICALGDRTFFLQCLNFIFYDFPSSWGYSARWDPHGSTSHYNFVFYCVRSSQGFLRIMKSSLTVFD